MDPSFVGFLLLSAIILILAAFILRPYWDWCRSGQLPLESFVARTSFFFRPGQLVPPPWQAQELTLSVIIPAFNEEYRLPQMLDEALTYLENRAIASGAAFSYEVLVIDDGSYDNTYLAAASFSNRVPGLRFGELRVMRLSSNCGKGFAVRAGMLIARGQWLLMADADGATSIRDIERLERAVGGLEPLALWQTSVANPVQVPNIAFGSRCHLPSKADLTRPWILNVLMGVAQLIVWLYVGGQVRDAQCGFKLFRAQVGKQIFASLHLFSWSFDVEVVILARFFGQRIAEVPVTYVAMPGSKLNVFAPFAILRDLCFLQVFYAFGIWQPAVLP